MMQQGGGRFHTYYKVSVVLIIETLLWMWNVKQQYKCRSFILIYVE